MKKKEGKQIQKHEGEGEGEGTFLQVDQKDTCKDDGWIEYLLLLLHTQGEI